MTISERTEYNKQWRKDNKECLQRWKKENYKRNHKTILATKRAYYKNNLEKHKHWNLKAKYGVTLEWYNQQLTAQYGKCAICGVPAEQCYQPLGVDHNHKTGHVRGLLCANCNRALGLFQDSTECLNTAVRYLQNYDSRSV